MPIEKDDRLGGTLLQRLHGRRGVAEPLGTLPTLNTFFSKANCVQTAGRYSQSHVSKENNDLAGQHVEPMKRI